MGFMCPKCGSSDTITVPKSTLEKYTGGSVACVGAISVEDVIKILKILKTILDIFVSIWGEKKKNEEKYTLCKHCGYYEKQS